MSSLLRTNTIDGDRIAIIIIGSQTHFPCLFVIILRREIREK